MVGNQCHHSLNTCSNSPKITNKISIPKSTNCSLSSEIFKDKNINKCPSKSKISSILPSINKMEHLSFNKSISAVWDNPQLNGCLNLEDYWTYFQPIQHSWKSSWKVMISKFLLKYLLCYKKNRKTFCPHTYLETIYWMKNQHIITYPLLFQDLLYHCLNMYW